MTKAFCDMCGKEVKGGYTAHDNNYPYNDCVLDILKRKNKYYEADVCSSCIKKIKDAVMRTLKEIQSKQDV